MIALPVSAQETRQYEDATGRTVEIPVQPQRIVALADHVVALPLIELDANIVGSIGRVDANGETYFRSVRDVFPIYLARNDLAMVGIGVTPDFEAVAATLPDLIIGRTWDSAAVEQLETIAPVVLLSDLQPPMSYFRDLADVSGRLELFVSLNDRYAARFAEARSLLGEHSHSYQMVSFGMDGQASACARFGALTQVLDDLDFTAVGLTASRRESQDGICSAVAPELLLELEADFIFDTYAIGTTDPQPLDPRLEVNSVIPKGCDLLPACREGRIVNVPRELALPITFTTLDMMLHHVVSSIAGRTGFSRSE